jgi:putative DNA primase/helicase
MCPNDLFLAEGPQAVVAAFRASKVPTEPFEAPTEPDDAPDEPSEPKEKKVKPAKVALKMGEQARMSEHFEVLGFNKDEYYIYHRAKKQVLVRTRMSLGKTGLLELASLQWWELNFAATSGAGKFDDIMATEHIYQLAHDKGVYSPDRVRSLGAWWDDNRVVFNHGNKLTVDGVLMDVDEIKSSFVYPQAKKLPAAVFPGLTEAEGRHLHKVARLMRWMKPGCAELLVGWLFLAPICGLLQWRPHLWITGPAGSGKSYIQNHFINALMGGLTEKYDGATSTEPGIRQQLESDTRPVTIDEFEPNDEVSRSKLETILSLIRQASSESQAVTAKGSAGGKGQTYHVRSMFMLSSINSLLNKDSDNTRITQIALRPPAGENDPTDNWPVLEEEMHKISQDETITQRLLGRALTLAPLVRDHRKRFTTMAAKKFGSQRHGDQFGTLLCGAWFFTSDAPPSDAQIQSFLDKFDWQDHHEAGPADQDAALDAIKTKTLRIDMSTGAETVSVFELVRDAYYERTIPAHTPRFETGRAKDLLARNGIKIVKFEDKFWVAFQPGHSALKKMVEKLPAFADLRATLKRLKDATTFNNVAQKFMGSVAKAVGVPIEAMGIEDDEGGPL